MRVVDKKNAINEIVDLASRNCKYQKMVICIDESSDIDFVDNVIENIDKTVIVLKYYYNKKNITDLHNMINNGVRVVMYNVALEHFYKLQTDNKFVLNVFVSQSNFVMPYIANVESVYGENLLICNTAVKDYTTILFLYELALSKIWSLLIQGEKVDTTIFKNIDLLVNSNSNFYPNLIMYAIYLKSEITEEYKDIQETDFPYYINLKLCAVLKMLDAVNQNDEQYVDFYKTELSSKDIEKAYSLILKNHLIDTLKYNSGNLIKLCVSILNRTKIIIKKYYNYKNIKINKLNKIVKNNAKILNIENLLYIAYIFNCV